MKASKRTDEITLTVSKAQLVERLFTHGRAFEKFVLLFAVCAFVGVGGIFVGRKLVHVGILDASPNYALISQAAHRNPSSDDRQRVRAQAKQSNGLSFSSLQLGSFKMREDADLFAKQFEVKCGKVLVRYRALDESFLVLCGNFADHQTANLFASKLKEVKSVPLRLHLNSRTSSLTSCEQLRE